MLMEGTPSIKVMFANIFGGIFDCEKIAATLISTYQHGLITKPIVLRLRGTDEK